MGNSQQKPLLIDWLWQTHPLGELLYGVPGLVAEVVILAVLLRMEALMPKIS